MALVDADGVVTELRDVAPPRLPVLRVAHPAPGDRATIAALRVIGALPPELSAMIDEVLATTSEDVTFELIDGRNVIWGGGDRGEEKARILTGLLKQRVKTIDVSSPDVVTIQ